MSDARALFVGGGTARTEHHLFLEEILFEASFERTGRYRYLLPATPEEYCGNIGVGFALENPLEDAAARVHRCDPLLVTQSLFPRFQRPRGDSHLSFYDDSAASNRLWKIREKCRRFPDTHLLRRFTHEDR